jgi:aspartate aminotransferase
LSTITLADRVQRVKPSATLAVSNKAKELKAAGKDIIGLGAGEPDFETPDHIKAAGIEAIKQGQTGYTAVDGTPELKKAVIDKFRRDNGLEYEPGQILVSAGGKHSFYNLAQALLNQGDEVIIPSPYWVSYPDMVLLAQGEPVIVETTIDQAFKISAQQLSDHITSRTRLFVINSPSNPTGSTYTRNELKDLGEVLASHPEVLIATDDMYEHILWADEPFTNILNACPDLYDRTIVLNGVSKAYAMTGWRIGYAGGPATLIAAMKKIQSQSTSNPCSISQAAATAALNGDQSCIQPMLDAFHQRHDHVVKRLNQIKGVKCLAATGAFYLFPDFSDAISSCAEATNDVEMAEYLLEKAGVAMVPGSAFGAEGYMRISYATDLDTLNKAIDRLQAILGST